MTDHQYRTLQRVANSDLSNLAGYVLGTPQIKASPETLQFGAVFHQMVLEPEKEAAQTTTWLSGQHSYDALVAMQHVVQANAELWPLIQNGERETIRQWIDPPTGLPLKAKLDVVVLPRRRHLIDLKTTSARSQFDFVRSITEYNYDRQAAFYLSSDPDAEYFEFVGVGKQPPYSLFRHALHRHCLTVERGFQKMNALLKRAKVELEKTDGWRPASWSKTEE